MNILQSHVFLSSGAGIVAFDPVAARDGVFVAANSVEITIEKSLVDFWQIIANQLSYI